MSGVSKDSLSIVAQIGWTTTSHTGGAVPVFAIGAGSEMFAGRQDNTDLPKKICKAMGVEF
jgi:alkaline phosphatase